ncbi:hypothetical protein Cob_v001920 [Colletotrichum orbiculare MAFF 240422]|uniref:5-formyltetrahydrofolate cyclo-ligase n=1 Tax=Colletotrichum orbiculare (strain 104-T / ATCC 96160 / CBS 514.97 / LARS 414 / MAFF 240422) TaxID=1213857 RepID=A0A484G672_COLOR|nr:hypothetical protein Cob_v001920 [Colletotrichum orbiculare MAFF 240422]
MTSPMTAAKQKLRSIMKDKLSTIAPEHIKTQSRIICENLKTLKPYIEAQRISIFLSMPSGEVQTDAIVNMV